MRNIGCSAQTDRHTRGHNTCRTTDRVDTLGGSSGASARVYTARHAIPHSAAEAHAPSWRRDARGRRHLLVPAALPHVAGVEALAPHHPACARLLPGSGGGGGNSGRGRHRLFGILLLVLGGRGGGRSGRSRSAAALEDVLGDGLGQRAIHLTLVLFHERAHNLTHHGRRSGTALGDGLLNPLASRGLVSKRRQEPADHVQLTLLARRKLVTPRLEVRINTLLPLLRKLAQDGDALLVREAFYTLVLGRRLEDRLDPPQRCQPLLVLRFHRFLHAIIHRAACIQLVMLEGEFPQGNSALPTHDWHKSKCQDDQRCQWLGSNLKISAPMRVERSCDWESLALPAASDAPAGLGRALKREHLEERAFGSRSVLMTYCSLSA